METTMTAGVVATKRPTFLTILCILSFLGIGLSLVFGLKNYFDAAALAGGSGATELEGTGIDSATYNDFMQSLGIDWGAMAKSYLIVTCLNVLVLVGVIMMWKRKKTGFFVYTAGEIAQCVVPFVLMGTALGGVQTIFMAVVGGLFVLLYALNLKHLS